MKKYICILLLSVLQTCLYAQHSQLSADSLNIIGNDYYRAERYMDALEVLGETMDLAAQTNNDNAYMSSILTIGNIYTIFDDYDQALHYYTLCLNKAESLKDDTLISKAKSNMLLCYAMLGKRSEAEACYRSIGTLRMKDVNQKRFYTYLNQALLAKAQKYYKGAIYFHTQALEYARNHNMNGRYVAAEMGQIGTVYEEIGNVKAAEEWYLKCKEFAEKGHFIGPLTTSFEKLATLYRKEGKDSLSMKYNKLFVQLSDSFFQQREFNSKRSLINKYEERLSDRTISHLKGQTNRLIWIIVAVSTFLLLLVALLIYIFRINHRLVNTQRLLIQKHQEHSQQLQMQNEIFTRMENGDSHMLCTSIEAPNIQSQQEDCDDAEISANSELLTKEQSDLLLVSIAHIMEDNSVICNPDFCLNTLSQMVNSNTKYVSWVINKSYGKNFKSFLNEYRIRIASQLLSDTSQIVNTTIAGISERVGYKSPASFHQAFKKIYGMTPAAYVKLIKQKQNF